MTVIAWLALAGVLAHASVAAEAGNLLNDGGFETPSPPYGGFEQYNPGQKLGAWTVVGEGNVATVSTNYNTRGYALVARRGQSFLDLTGLCDCGAASGVSQSVGTTPNAPYTLTFWVGNAYIQGAGTKCTVKVYNGSTLLASAPNARGRHLKRQIWKKFIVPFTAASGTTTLSFINHDKPGDIDCGLDMIDLVAG